MVHFDNLMNTKDINLFQKKLLDWYQIHARDLPWRQTNDPYQIWISEIMLQQTRVTTVIPYYLSFINSYPSVIKLAQAEEDQVLSDWEGLGYYSRARNLHKTAKIIAERYQGEFPQDPLELQSLPGIGVYTSGAVVSIAFGKKAPIIDGNIRRVFTRYFNIDTPIQTKITEDTLLQLADDLLPESGPGIFNQALMELGALICLPKKPHCGDCPLGDNCIAYRLNLQACRPVRKQKQPIPHLQVAAAVIQENGGVLIAKRPPGGLLGGMWEFPGGTQEPCESLTDTLKREFREELELKIRVGGLLGTFKHAYTHYRVTLHAYRCELVSRDIQLKFHTNYSWVPIFSLAEYPMGKLDRLISNQLLKKENDDKTKTDLHHYE